MAWPGVAVSIGVTVGAIVGGVAFDAGGAHAGLAVCAAGAVLTGLAGIAVAVSARRATDTATA